jgi:hypothetical protein
MNEPVKNEFVVEPAVAREPVVAGGKGGLGRVTFSSSEKDWKPFRE